jgi:hypothetical protein
MIGGSIKKKVLSTKYYEELDQCSLSAYMDELTTDEFGLLGQKLNEVERVLYTGNPHEGDMYIETAMSASIAMLMNFYFVYDETNANAFLHSYYSGWLALEIGVDRAELWMNAHEYGRQGNISNATNMDLLNNRKGTAIATSDFMKTSYEVYSYDNFAILLSANLMYEISNGNLYRYINGRLKPTDNQGTWLKSSLANGNGKLSLAKDRLYETQYIINFFKKMF